MHCQEGVFEVHVGWWRVFCAGVSFEAPEDPRRQVEREVLFLLQVVIVTTKGAN